MPLDCKEIENQIETYLDDEVTLSDRREIDEHLQHCPDCAAKLMSCKMLQASIGALGYENTPASLKKNISKQLKDVTGEETRTHFWLHWMNLSGGSLALASVTIWAVLTFNVGLPIQHQLEDEIISSHVRSLMLDHAVDVVSTDTHTVKPWFNGKLDFSPPVKKLEYSGFKLIGGRLDYVQKHTVPAMVYKKREHIVNLFVIPNTPSAANNDIKYIQRQGYNIYNWNADGMSFWVISDLNKEELREFAKLYS